MAFGKRTSGQAPPSYTPPVQPEIEDDASAPMVRTRVANSGGIDRNFIGLAVGVVVLSAGGAIAAPSLMSMMSSTPVRPVHEVIAGLDRNGIRTALSREAFPDSAGQAFMTSLAVNFPDQHERLLDRLADTASAGGDRDDLFATYNGWSMEFAPLQMAALSRTGAEGFNRSIDVLGDAIDFIEAEANGCTAKRLETFITNPTALSDLTRYGGNGYALGMRAGQTLVELAAKGKNAEPVDAVLTPDDENVLRSKLISLITDPQILGLVQSVSMGGAMNAEQNPSETVNICQLARTVMIKLDSLPAGTKGRLFATALSSAPTALMGGGAFGSPFGAGLGQGGMPSFDAEAIDGTRFFP